MNDMREFDARIRKNPAWLTVDLYLSKQNPDGSQERVQSLVMEHLPREDVGLETQPLRLSEEAAQHLMDDLWADGFRPASARYSSETLQAKEDHLQDARGLAQRLLDIALKQRQRFVVVPDTMHPEALQRLSEALNGED